MIIAGHWNQEAVVYPVSREATLRGRSLINWVAMLRIGGKQPSREDWSRQGRLEDFLPRFSGWRFGVIDLPALFRATERILEYPVVDRDPVARWSFGRVTLLGDAAHPMYPMGSNGAAQAILDADTLAAALDEADGDVVSALARYEAARLPATTAVTLSNREFGPERVLQAVEERIRGPEDDIAAVITREELDQITRRYSRIAGFDVETLNRKSGQGISTAKPQHIDLRDLPYLGELVRPQFSDVTRFRLSRNHPEVPPSYLCIPKSSRDGSKSPASRLLEVQMTSTRQHVHDNRPLSSFLAGLARLIHDKGDSRGEAPRALSRWRGAGAARRSCASRHRP